ncbi:CDP-alcohol phosphatidyltransferase-like enzyme [Haloactinospora alba]|uniref:CDP-alcohol phosphatidyltransferase-like enzyme n=1 Tax=Haloactinospora alba TaxID=405555 RepID=A0A543NNY8_9ACTN|nr:CDP-alcohol phosphatidyltransferase family protein [Haloactinospora alba]TQN33535.1 CDP-alcohol phosphatidyltransferase-like enzyme [Haloactinospora alba]
MNTFSLDDVRQQTYKRRDSWWTVFLVDPLAARLVRTTANRTSLTPNHLTTVALLLGLAAAACFAMVEWPWLVAGAVLFHLSFVIDCMDGKIARLKHNGSVFGSWLDYVFDRLRVLACAVALMGGQYVHTGNDVFIWAALGIVFTDMFRYLNAPQLGKVRSTMRSKLVKAIRDSENAGVERSATAAGQRLSTRLQGQQDEETELHDAEPEDAPRSRADGTAPAPVDDSVPESPAPLTHDNGTGHTGVENAPDAPNAPEEELTGPSAHQRVLEMQATELQRSFNSRFPWYWRLRTALRDRRIRPHLFSGIEFQMGTFIVAPLVGTVSAVGMLVVVAASAVLMLGFELLLVYKLWLSTREFSRILAGIEADTAAALDAEGEGGPEAAESTDSAVPRQFATPNG